MSYTHGKSIQRYVSVMVLFFAMAGFSSPAAWAHALLKSSSPAANSAVSAGEIVFTLKYNSRVDPRHSTLSLLGPAGKVIPLAIDDHSAAAVLSSKTTLTDKGGYELRWQALSGDGHITRGQVPFRVR
jgi:hypothetical protein